MAKKVTGLIRLQIPAGAANPAPPIGPALGSAGCNIMEFCKQFNAATQSQSGMIIPVVITVYQDRSFTFICKSPPAAVLVKKAAGVASGARSPARKRPARSPGRRSVKSCRSRRKTSTPVTKRRPCASSKAPRAAWESRWSMRRSKLYRKQVEVAGFDAQKRYSVAEAIALLKGMPGVKFDQTAEVAFKLGVDPRKSDQTVRGAVALPRGTGKTVRVAVVADGALAQDARDAGADFVGYEDIVEKIKGGWQDFDMLIATPDAMRLVRPLGRQLGPRGLMPNPKTGTVTDQVGTAVREAKAGRAEFRADRGACVHVPFGKMSFEADALKENFDVIVEALNKAKPTTAKGAYILSCTISATMTPGVKINVKELVRSKE